MQRKYLIVFLSFFFGSCLTEDKKIYEPLIEKFEAYEKLEQENFQKLTFTLSEKQFQKSVTLKIILNDQLGRSWMFKGNENIESSSSDGAVAAYRIYNLFGLNVPETHYLTISVNGKKVPGHIQLFIPNIGTFEKNEVFYSMSSLEQSHVAKNHLLSWLIANHHVHQGQFLVSSGNHASTSNRLFRVDNSIQWFLIGRDPFDINYQPAHMWEIPLTGYYRFWRSFLNGKFDFSLQEVYEWAYFISKFPRKKYGSFFQLAIENKLRHLANNGHDPNEPFFLKMYPDLFPLVDEKTFLPSLLKRKENLLTDISPLYSKLLKIRGEHALQQPSKEHLVGIGDFLIKNLEDKTNYQKIIQNKIGLVEGGTEVKVEFLTSFEAYPYLRSVLGCYLLVDKELCVRSAVIKEVEKIRRVATHPLERQALDNALINLQYIIKSYQRGLVYSRGQLLHLNRFFEKTDYWKRPLDQFKLGNVINK